MRTPLLVAMLALAAPSSWGAAMLPEFFSPDFVGPLSPQQQAEKDAYLLQQQQQALNTVGNSNGCIPWHPPCKAPENSDKKQLEQEGTVAGGENWVKTPDGWSDCSGGVCKMPVPCPQAGAPCKAEEDQRKKDAEKKSYEDANSRMWGNNNGNQTQSGPGSSATRSKATPGPVAGGPGGFSALSVEASADEPGGGMEASGLAGGGGIKGVVDDALGGQPDNSPLWNENDGGSQGYGEGNVGLGQGLSALAANMTDNGNAVAPAGPGGSRSASGDRVSSLGQLNRMNKPQNKGGSNDTIMDWLTSAWTFDRMKTDSAPTAVGPGYKQTAFFGTKPQQPND